MAQEVAPEWPSLSHRGQRGLEGAPPRLSQRVFPASGHLLGAAWAVAQGSELNLCMFSDSEGHSQNFHGRADPPLSCIRAAMKQLSLHWEAVL